MNAQTLSIPVWLWHWIWFCTIIDADDWGDTWMALAAMALGICLRQITVLEAQGR